MFYFWYYMNDIAAWNYTDDRGIKTFKTLGFFAFKQRIRDIRWGN